MFTIFKNYSLDYGISVAADGNMHLSFKDNQQNRAKFFQQQKIGDKKAFAADLVHGTKVTKINSADENFIIPETDGLISSERNIVLTITVADCFPIYFYNPKENKIGLAHSGWRGTVSNIAAKVIQAMDCKPEDVFVGIGPGIQSCHFEVKEDIIESFKAYPKAVIYRQKKVFINLPSIIKEQLANSGVKIIEDSAECTYCNQDKYFSFRRDKPEPIEAMLAYIAKTNWFAIISKALILSFLSILSFLFISPYAPET